jgi:hypothetical protein
MDANTRSPLHALETSCSGNGVYLFNVSSTDHILTNMDHHNHKRASLYPTIDLTLKRIGEKAIERHRIFTGSNEENTYKQLRKKLWAPYNLLAFARLAHMPRGAGYRSTTHNRGERRKHLAMAIKELVLHLFI